MKSLFNQSSITGVHWRYRPYREKAELPMYNVESENIPTWRGKPQRELTRRQRIYYSPVDRSKNDLLGPILYLARDTPIGMHEVLKDLTIPSRFKFPNKALLSKQRVAKLLELTPLLVVNSKQGIKALNHGFLLSRISAHPELRPDHITTREVHVKPGTNGFYELVFDIHVAEFAYSRVTSSPLLNQYIDRIKSVFLKRDRGRKTMEKLIGNNQSFESGIAEFMGIDHKGVKK